MVIVVTVAWGLVVMTASVLYCSVKGTCGVVAAGDGCEWQGVAGAEAVEMVSGQ